MRNGRLTGWLLVSGCVLVRFAGGQAGVGGRQAKGEGAADKEALRVDEVVRPSERFPAQWYPVGDEVTRSVRAVTGAPYEATTYVAAMEESQATAAATDKVLMEGTEVRDRWGRTRAEETRPAHDGTWNEGPVARRRVAVVDPVSHCNFTWFEPLAGPPPPASVATVSCFNKRIHYESTVPFGPFDESQGAEAQVVHEGRNGDIRLRDEPLGKREVNGVEALGVRHTSVFPAEPKGQGGTPEQTIVAEIWWAPSIREIVSMKQIAGPPVMPEVGRRAIRLVEPDPAMFYPPAGYRIVKEGEAVP